MTKTEYADYIRSEHWQQRRKQAIANTGQCCERCYLPRWLARLLYDQDLHVHHRNYQNLGNEKPDDLEVVCRRCHDIESLGRSSYREPQRVECLLCNIRHWDIYSDFCLTCRSIIDDESPDYIFHKLHREYDKVPVWQWLLHLVSEFAYTKGVDTRQLLGAIYSGVKSAGRFQSKNHTGARDE